MSIRVATSSVRMGRILLYDWGVRRQLLVPIVSVLVAACGSPRPAPGRAPARRPPNIVLLISDDHSSDDTGAGGNGAIRTPALDRLAAEGALFRNAYTASPQCSPARAAIVTGRSPHATATSRLHATLTAEHDTVVDALRRAGYHAAAYRKVHLGEAFQSRWDGYGGDDVPFARFFRERPRDRPFFLWVGFHDPHRPYQPGAVKEPHDPARVRLPGFLPATEEIRRDLVSYADEIARMDGELAELLAELERDGSAVETMVVFVGDNGMPFPGAKGSLYDAGVNVPFIVRWPGVVQPGQVRDEVVSLLDLAPTWLEAAGAPPLPRMEGRSLVAALRGAPLEERAVFFERNWHDNLELLRGVRRGRHLLVQNFRPEIAYQPTLDLAGSPSWHSIEERRRAGALDPALERRYFAAPRPEVELYDVDADPAQLHDLVGDAAQAATVRALQQELSDWMVETSDFLPPPIPPVRGEHGESPHGGH
ncbi:MAG TPA: sulfatase [Kofleriaceae bacterium]|nr:sulfatase [Kofleriaceae bacterium]